MDNHSDAKESITPQADPSPHLGIQNQVSDLPDHKAEPHRIHPPAGAAGPAGNPIVRFFKSHPTGFWFFFWGEFAERSSFYGMRAILSLYMADRLGLGTANAGTYMAFFVAACYFLPLLGGYVADRYFGKYWTIVGFSLPYILGQCLIGIENPYVLVGALALLAMGSGVIKPNISTLMGLTYDQERPGQEKLRSDAFSIFYFAINVGAAIASFALPQIRNAYGYKVAFAFPAVLMAIAFFVFAIGKPFYARETITRTRKTPEERAEQWRVLRNVFGLFLLVMFFWAIFDQSTSTWIFFARDYMDCTLFGKPVSPDQIQTFNPVFIIILLPLVMVFWKALDRAGVRVRATDKMVVGFLLTAACMGIMALSALLTTPEHKVSVWWQVLAYLVITVAEILISVTGLELGYTAAPKSMTGFVTACWLVTVGMGNLVINAPVTRLYTKMPPQYYFGMLSLTLLVVTVAFVFVARKFNRLAEARAKVPSGADEHFTPSAAPSEEVTRRDQVQNPE
jgi:POT family proton-dependent oligopeptide transporter